MTPEQARRIEGSLKSRETDTGNPHLGRHYVQVPLNQYLIGMSLIEMALELWDAASVEDADTELTDDNQKWVQWTDVIFTQGLPANQPVDQGHVWDRFHMAATQYEESRHKWARGEA